jgi:signal transduction histidine kinase
MDGARLQQVFENLLDNAAEHSPSEGVVTIRASVTEQAGRNWIECSVEDEGPGFDAEAVDRAFEPFFTKRQGGTGLGLSIVQRIVEEHSGKVFADNVPGGGAMIRVRLPVAET